MKYYNYTPLGQKLGFGSTRKLPRFNDRKRVNIRNMDPFTIVESRGFGAVQILSFWPSGVYNPEGIVKLHLVSKWSFTILALAQFKSEDR
jgi:hypothetical protein